MSCITRAEDEGWAGIQGSVFREITAYLFSPQAALGSTVFWGHQGPRWPQLQVCCPISAASKEMECISEGPKECVCVGVGASSLTLRSRVTGDGSAGWAGMPFGSCLSTQLILQSQDSLSGTAAGKFLAPEDGFPSLRSCISILSLRVTWQEN